MYLKILILGDSISEGLGSKKYNYSDFLKEKLYKKGINIEVFNLAYSGTTIKYVESIKKSIKEINPDVTILFYGNVDGMLRPNINHYPNYFGMLPKRYQKNGMLNPRPFYSRVWYKKLIQMIDSFIRTTLNKTLLKFQGSYTWVSLDDFKIIYDNVVNFLLSINSKIICTSTVSIDEKYFPGTLESYKKFNDIIQSISEGKENVYFFDIFNELQVYKIEEVFLLDHFHPSINGYKILANKYANLIDEIYKCK